MGMEMEGRRRSGGGQTRRTLSLLLSWALCSYLFVSLLTYGVCMHRCMLGNIPVMIDASSLL